VSVFGRLNNLHFPASARRLEVRPYALASAYTAPAEVGDPFFDGDDWSQRAGFDLRYGLGASYTLDATVNPDFGQVEVDPAVINLGTYEVFFEERRPFFVEGNEIFDFGRNTSGGQMFYSRRNGRAPQLRAPGAADAPDGTTILGAAKFTGKTGGWSLGLIEAVTAEETARFLPAPGAAPDEFTVEPLSNYLVARARRDLRQGRSAVGFMFTSANRRLGTSEAEAALRAGAYAGGIDFRHEFANRAWVVQGTAAWSHIRGSSEALVRVQRAGNHFFQRPDADHLGVRTDLTSMTGHSVGVSLTRQAGTHWRGLVALAETSPDYEVNDLGFQTRTDRRDAQVNLTYVETRPGSFFRNYSLTLYNRFEHNFDWERIQAFSGLNANFRTLGFWSGGLRLARFQRSWDDRSTRGGPLMERPARWQAGLNLGTDSRKPLSFGLNLNGVADDYDGWSAGGGLNLSYRSDRWNVSTGPAFSRSFTDAQYVTTLGGTGNAATFGSDYIFAPLEQTSVSLNTRLNVTFTPRLSLETFLQPFISTGDFGPLAELVAPKSYAFVERPDLEDAGPDPDFNFRSLRGNAVLRWEWRPGSTLFLAWQQVRSDYAQGIGDFDLGRDRTALFDAQPDNIFVFKINYWLTP
jgi:hypothetical protein